MATKNVTVEDVLDALVNYMNSTSLEQMTRDLGLTGTISAKNVDQALRNVNVSVGLLGRDNVVTIVTKQLGGLPNVKVSNVQTPVTGAETFTGVIENIADQLDYLRGNYSNGNQQKGIAVAVTHLQEAVAILNYLTLGKK